MDRHRRRLESRLYRELSIAEINLDPAPFPLDSLLQQSTWSECRSLGERDGTKNSGRGRGTR